MQALRLSHLAVRGVSFGHVQDPGLTSRKGASGLIPAPPKTVLGTSQAVSSEKGAEDPADAQSMLLE